VPLVEAFDNAGELALVGLAEVESVASSNVFDVALYGQPSEIPSEFLPGHPSHRFAHDLEITAY